MLRHSAARFTSSSLRETTTKRREDDEDGGEDDGNESSDNKPSGGLLSDEKGKCASRSLDVTRPPRVRDAQIYLRGRAGSGLLHRQRAGALRSSTSVFC